MWGIYSYVLRKIEKQKLFYSPPPSLLHHHQAHNQPINQADTSCFIMSSNFRLLAITRASSKGVSSDSALYSHCCCPCLDENSLFMPDTNRFIEELFPDTAVGTVFNGANPNGGPVVALDRLKLRDF